MYVILIILIQVRIISLFIKKKLHFFLFSDQQYRSYTFIISFDRVRGASLTLVLITTL